MAQPGIDFSAYITDRTRDFTGREWVLVRISHWATPLTAEHKPHIGGPYD